MATSTSTLGPIRTVELPEGRIRYHETGTADGPVIVFVHGIIANADVWRHVVPVLAERYRCITPDWPLGGHVSPMAAGTDFSLPGLADLIDRTLAALDLDEVVLGQRLAGLLPAAELAVIEDSGPFVGEDAPTELAQLITEFLARRLHRAPAPAKPSTSAPTPAGRKR